MRGFKNANRLEGLDQTHTERVLLKLAQWHAASAARVATKGPYPQDLIIGFFKDDNRQMMTEMTKSLGEKFLKCCATYEGNEAYIEKVVSKKYFNRSDFVVSNLNFFYLQKELQPVILDKMFEMAKVDPTEFNVLNHGDSWANNIMFQYDAFGKIKEVYMVDYQLPKYGTVAQDLQYFLLSSTKFEDKLSKFEYYIKTYHSYLVEHLKILKYSKPIPSLRDIHLSLLKHGSFGKH
ncbi:hypothetical protein KR200_010706 [Drosophila serrata]|nr:hypothetical protein KR200_010706 [Drosophila serrata]